MTKNANISISLFLPFCKKKCVFAFCVIAFESIKIQICSEPQNDRLNLNFIKDIYLADKKMAQNNFKTAFYRLQIFYYW